MASRMGVNVKKLVEKVTSIPYIKIKDMSHTDAQTVLKSLSDYQKNSKIPDDVVGYDINWKTYF
jgi:hypothetical protein